MKLIKINRCDTVAVATEDIKKGQSLLVDGQEITAKSDIPFGHKIAVKSHKKGEDVIKYGYPIGYATDDIALGEHIHSHNLHSKLSELLSYKYEPDFSEIPQTSGRTFMGYKRKDGSVGIRNEIWIIPTVGCVNSVVSQIEKQAQPFISGSIDGICAYQHPYGCSQLGDDMKNTLMFLAGMIKHPNASYVLVVGLGCENGNIDELIKVLGEYDRERVRFLIAQQEDDEVQKGVEIVKEFADNACKLERTECNVSQLTVGLKCGGSDGFSGLTANPLVGMFSDKLIGMGGSTILTEVPEMFGAETILMNRCRNEKVFDKTVDLINGFKQYFMKYGEPIDENPSPGNKAGGITTLEEKSLGCVQKGGCAPVEDVLKYGEKTHCRGLSLLQACGNDLVASNALAVSGAQIVLFTTGIGTPFGCPVPTVKISSNTPLYEKKKSWIDFNAGSLLDGSSVEALTDEFFEFIIKVASGEIKAASEKWDKHELAIFKDGVTL